MKFLDSASSSRNGRSPLLVSDGRCLVLAGLVAYGLETMLCLETTLYLETVCLVICIGTLCGEAIVVNSLVSSCRYQRTSLH